ncbi:hypothetical protein D9M69_614820 [compost metagenome]
MIDLIDQVGSRFYKIRNVFFLNRIGFAEADVHFLQFAVRCCHGLFGGILLFELLKDNYQKKNDNQG